jgi:hypothetical protein
LAVRFGKTLIIQEVDGVEPVLYPLLRGDLVSQGKLLRYTITSHSIKNLYIRAGFDLARPRSRVAIMS